VEQIAELLRERNAVDRRISSLIGRPMAAGHLGEWIGAEVFDIELEHSAVAAAVDGRFRSGPLQGRTVNVKCYLRREGLLDMTETAMLDLYLVLAGPRGAAASSRGGVRPWCITSVHLFEAQELLVAQRERGVKIGTASSVPSRLWDTAEIYPRPTNEATTAGPELDPTTPVNDQGK
jgi:hypothetical protein